MSADSDLERTEPASERKLEKAREDGDVPRSRELSMVILLVASGSILWIMGQNLFSRLGHILSNSLTFSKEQAFDITEISRIASQNVVEAFVAFAPLGVVVILATVASPLLIGGWVFSAKSVGPNFGKLNPISGLSNIASKNSAVELVKSVLKTLFVGLVAWVVVKGKMDEFTRLSDMSIDSGV